ncbi:MULTISPECIES: LacI family DNA-binding transcriptional regulator [Mammaliicoccus]|uniref:LacI family DNA-binding transcriptional regulator n=1 Tax=Mammaliicoccus fleurettii TaxID=150056 RepID=A0ABS5MQJ1_9STAP|nr:LacI family DNA-binding transcriptional regulator [Mammaliicoccus fleurettii]MBL0848388.1 LacI family DNA-binding transcriptional regulator [Mammaliicoccus fleurettii]MBO3061849.1 LacI family DNA-binding transcriptional regulator [Mammaliicoccus fleurettii]MBS3673150.1 LacI family DNA-binding transcriptional regulator [Mammaliicoccus fleurettii]MBS3698205.1 LacI family DNA-binding transcriptional regulator [Mammaliicoccus fleurettii]MEB6201327.1 LacI family transcriptional regulator [Mammal
MVTIKDVAKEANVAPSTVSRVISGHKSISDKTSKKVKAVMKQLGYQPNIAARTLVTQKSKTIGLILKSASKEMTQNPFFTDVLMGISIACKQREYSTIMTTSIEQADLLVEVENLIKSKSIDGFIMLYSKENDPVTQLLKKYQFPFVVVGKQLGEREIIHIDNDNVEASQMITEFMIHKGHDHIAFIAEPDSYAVALDRVEGFKKACDKHSINQFEIYHANPNRDEILAIIKEMKETTTFPTAIITSDSMININLLSALYELNIRVPDEVMTATFNDSFINTFASPPQTVVNIYPEHLGEEAGIALIKLIENPNILRKNTVIPTEIIERKSTIK